MKNELTIKKSSVKFLFNKSRLKSFQYAFRRIERFFSTQHNAIHSFNNDAACI
jgi:hypothetical protein